MGTSTDRLHRPIGIRMLHFAAELSVFAIACGLVMGQARTGSQDNRGDFVFPGPSASDRASNGSGRHGGQTVAEPECCSDFSSSLLIARRINDIDTVDEFLKMVGGAPREETAFSLHSRIGDGERSNAEVARPAKCIPELQPVPVKEDADPSTIYYPSCVRIKRCGGCCSHSLLSCQPVATEVRNFQVLVTKVDGDERLSYKGKEIVPLEEHTKCKCDCRIKPEHCSEKQSYTEDECRCVCTNNDEEEKCKRNNETKLWDPEICSCLCRREQECSTGFYFDQNTCRCREVPISRNWFGGTRTGYRFGQTQRPENIVPVIVPLDATDERRKPKDDPEYK